MDIRIDTAEGVSRLLEWRRNRWIVTSATGLALILASWALWFTAAPTDAANTTDFEFPELWGLAHDSRAELAVCVATDEQVTRSSADVAEIVRSTAKDLRINEASNWALGRIGDRDPVVADDCSFEVQPPPPDEQFAVLSPGGLVFGRGEVDTPSPYRVVVFVLDDAARARLVPEFPFGKTAFELVCERNEFEFDCREVTTALFVPESVLDDPGHMKKALGWALGVDDLQERMPALRAADEILGNLPPSTSSK